MLPKDPPRLHVLCFAWALPQGGQPGSAGWEAGGREVGRLPAPVVWLRSTQFLPGLESSLLFLPLTHAGSAANRKNMVDSGTRKASFERSSAIYLLRSKFLASPRLWTSERPNRLCRSCQAPDPARGHCRDGAIEGDYYYCLCSVFIHF